MMANGPVTYELPARRTRDRLPYAADFTAWAANEGVAITGAQVTVKTGDVLVSGTWNDGGVVRFNLAGGTPNPRVQYLAIVVTTDPPLTGRQHEIEASIVILE